MSDGFSIGDEASRRALQQEGLLQLGNRLVRGASTVAIVDDVIEIVRATLRIDVAWVLKYLEDEDRFLVWAGTDRLTDTTGAGERVSAGPNTVPGYTLRAEVPVVIEDRDSDSRFAPSAMQKYGLVSGISVPIRDEESFFGSLVAYTHMRRSFLKDEVGFLEAVGNLLASAVQRERHSEQIRFQSQLLEQIGATVVVVDTQGRITFWNSAAEKMWGWTAAEAIGRDVLELIVVPEETEQATKVLGELAAGAHGAGDWQIRTKDGSILPVHVSQNPVVDDHGDVTAIVSVAFDISDRKSMERELRASESKFRTAFTHSQLGMVISGADGRWVEVNPAICSMLGYERDQLVGIHFSTVTHPEDAKSDVGHLHEMLANPAGVTSFSQRYIHRSGRIVWAEIHAALVRNPDGSPGVVILQIEDVTGSRHHAEERERLEGQLLQAQKMEAVGRLAGGIAHDFNNLLSVIINYSSFLEEDLPEGDSKLEDVREIRRAGERATALVRQLLAFSRKEIAAGSDVNLNDVVRDMDKLLRRATGEEVAIEFKLVSESWPVLVDPSQVEQIIMNLVVNAGDAMPKGGRLTLLTSNEIVTDEQARSHPGLSPGRYGCLTVADTGEGIPDEIKDHIFEPFFTTKPRGRGTGLGLSTVYGIVKQWLGYVSVFSQPGEGTAFKIYLPVTTGDGPGVQAPLPESAVSRKATETILVAEDEDAVREMVERILVRQGYRVIAARSGTEALELLDLHGDEVDLLLTDVVMPKMSGKELVDTIAAGGRDLRTVYMSGYADDLVSESGILQGDEAFLQKPFSAEALLAKVRGVLQG